MDYEAVHIPQFPVAPSNHDFRRTKSASSRTRKRRSGARRHREFASYPAFPRRQI